jgi:LmbE family N-acetylglucosaminyl deacetylase
MAQAVESGARVEVLTVFGCEPTSTAPAAEWDRKSGFTTEGEAAAQRRDEDRRACSILGVATRWFDFGAEPYERRASIDEVSSAVAAAIAGADTVLIPGYPLAHADHAALSSGLLCRGLECHTLGLYAEQPYSYDRRATPHGPAEALPAGSAGGHSLPWQRAAADFNGQRSVAGFTWQPTAARRSHRHLKLQAVKQYASQLRSLGLRQTGLGHVRLHLMLWREARQGGETIAWRNAT